jgi:hypothetical protein
LLASTQLAIVFVVELFLGLEDLGSLREENSPPLIPGLDLLNPI